MNLKSRLLKEANKTLGVKHETKAVLQNVSPTQNLDRLTRTIQTDLSEMREIQEFVMQKRHRYNELRESVLKNLIYVRDHRKELGIPSFEGYLSSEIGITKGYFYEQVQAYELCVNTGRPELFLEVDYKLLVMIARIKDPKEQERLLKDAKTLNRETLRLAVSPADYSGHSASPLAIKDKGEKEWTLVFPKPLTKSQKEELQELLFSKVRDWWGTN